MSKDGIAVLCNILKFNVARLYHKMPRFLNIKPSLIRINMAQTTCIYCVLLCGYFHTFYCIVFTFYCIVFTFYCIVRIIVLFAFYCIVLSLYNVTSSSLSVLG
jgi:hypothetical protein